MYSTKEARYFHDLVLRLFASAGAHANITQYASQGPALLAFVQAGLGVTLVPASAMASSPPGVEFHEISGSHGIRELNRVDLELARNEQTANPAVRRLLQLIDSTGLNPGDRLDMHVTAKRPRKGNACGVVFVELGFAAISPRARRRCLSACPMCSELWKCR